MQSTSNVNTILQNISNLSTDEQFYIAEILDKRIYELKRQRIVRRAEEAELNYKNDKTTTGKAEDLLKLLEND